MKKPARTPAFEMAFETAAFNAAVFNPRPLSEAIRLRMHTITYALPVNENEDLYRELERRYGGGYAQNILEGLKRSQKN